MEKAKKFEFAKCAAYESGGIVSKTVIENGGGNVSLFAFAKGQGLSEHSAPFDALVQIIEGVAEIKIGGAAQKLSAGESVIMPANVPHALSATQNFKMLLTMIRK